MGGFLNDISDTQFTAIAGIFFLGVAYLPLTLLAFHKYGHYPDRVHPHKKVRGPQTALYNDTASRVSCYMYFTFILSGLLGAAVTAYWWQANPAYGLVSEELFLATIFSFAGYVATTCILVAATFHGTDKHARILAAILATCCVVTMTVTSGWTLSRIAGTKPAALLFAFIVFLAHAALNAYFLLVCYKHSQNLDEYIMTSFQFDSETERITSRATSAQITGGAPGGWGDADL